MFHMIKHMINQISGYPKFHQKPSISGLLIELGDTAGTISLTCLPAEQPGWLLTIATASPDRFLWVVKVRNQPRVDGNYKLKLI